MCLRWLGHFSLGNHFVNNLRFGCQNWISNSCSSATADPITNAFDALSRVLGPIRAMKIDLMRLHSIYRQSMRTVWCNVMRPNKRTKDKHRREREWKRAKSIKGIGSIWNTVSEHWRADEKRKNKNRMCNFIVIGHSSETTSKCCNENELWTKKTECKKKNRMQERKMN